MRDISAAPKGYYHNTINDTLEMLPVLFGNSTFAALPIPSFPWGG